MCAFKMRQSFPPGRRRMPVTPLRPSGARCRLPEIPVRGQQVLIELGERSVHLDIFLTRTEYRSTGEVHRRVSGVVAGERQKLGLLEAINQPANIRPIERTCA